MPREPGRLGKISLFGRILPRDTERGGGGDLFFPRTSRKRTLREKETISNAGLRAARWRSDAGRGGAKRDRGGAWARRRPRRARNTPAIDRSNDSRREYVAFHTTTSSKSETGNSRISRYSSVENEACDRYHLDADQRRQRVRESCVLRLLARRQLEHRAARRQPSHRHRRRLKTRATERERERERIRLDWEKKSGLGDGSRFLQRTSKERGTLCVLTRARTAASGVAHSRRREPSSCTGATTCEWPVREREREFLCVVVLVGREAPIL